mmetsp:Transcript_4285/g.6346  ORF Transcript_4285/g.6346 Transcript_4285/m.6346 type:complete len:234 (-) Transcript_4285:79-780(-)
MSLFAPRSAVALLGKRQLKCLNQGAGSRQEGYNFSAAITHVPSGTSFYSKEDDEDSKGATSSSRNLFIPIPRRDLSQVRSYHASGRKENVTLVMTLGVVALTAKAGQHGVRAYKEWKEIQSKEQPPTQPDEASEPTEEGSSKQQKSSDATKDNIFSQLFGFSIGSKYYEGGFDEKMSRREAALILGVRESSSVKRIKEAHRRILILNHPDTGGSTYLTSKVNEAKELLLKGKE